jgi:hypothetical protein
MVKTSPLIVIVPLRGVGLGLAATEKLSVSLPVPLSGDVRVTKLAALLVAVQWQPCGNVIVTLPVPPLAAKLWLLILSDRQQVVKM